MLVLAVMVHMLKYAPMGACPSTLRIMISPCIPGTMPLSHAMAGPCSFPIVDRTGCECCTSSSPMGVVVGGTDAEACFRRLQTRPSHQERTGTTCGNHAYACPMSCNGVQRLSLIAPFWYTGADVHLDHGKNCCVIANSCH